MRRRVFLGGSREAIEDLNGVAAWLESEGVDAVRWNGPELFLPSSYTLPELIRISGTVDGAVLIFTPDDKTWFRGTKVRQPRDNVVLEYGLFAARLGYEWAIICLRDNPKVASDLHGLNCLDISKAKQSTARQTFSEWARKLPSAIPDPLPANDAEVAVRAWLAAGVNEPAIVSRLRRLNFPTDYTGAILKRLRSS